MSIFIKYLPERYEISICLFVLNYTLTTPYRRYCIIFILWPTAQVCQTMLNNTNTLKLLDRSAALVR